MKSAAPDDNTRPIIEIPRAFESSTPRRETETRDRTERQSHGAPGSASCTPAATDDSRIFPSKALAHHNCSEPVAHKWQRLTRPTAKKYRCPPGIVCGINGPRARPSDAQAMLATVGRTENLPSAQRDCASTTPKGCNGAPCNHLSKQRLALVSCQTPNMVLQPPRQRNLATLFGPAWYRKPTTEP